MSRAIFLADDGTIAWETTDASIVADAQAHSVHLADCPEARAALMRADMDRTDVLALVEPDAAQRAAQGRAEAILADLPELRLDRRPEGDDVTDAQARADLLMADLARAGMRFTREVPRQ